MFFGKYHLTLSETSQLTLPSDLREAMGTSVFVTQGFDRNLFLMSQQAFNVIYSHVRATSISDPLARLLSRLFLGGAVEVAIDSSGRIELPLSLCEYSELCSEIILVGQGDYLEIWSPAHWKSQLNTLNDFDTNTHRFEKFHISLT